MAKGTGLAIFTLILALGGIGFGVFSYITLMGVQQAPGVHQTYYDEKSTGYTSPAEDTWYAIPDLSITFKVESGESAYFMFTCTAKLYPVSAVTFMHFRLKIDDNSYLSTEATVGPTGGTDSNNFYSIAIQYSNSTLGVGSHTVVVETMRETSASSFVDNCALIVQTYT